MSHYRHMLLSSGDIRVRCSSWGSAKVLYNRKISDNDQTIENIRTFQKICIDMATGTVQPYETYEDARNTLMADLTNIKSAIPDWIITHRYGSHYWRFIKTRFDHYEERHIFLHTSFDELVEYLQGNGSHPVSTSVKVVVAAIQADELEDIWRKINLRKDTDIAGAITAARTMVETTLKYILD